MPQIYTVLFEQYATRAPGDRESIFEPAWKQASVALGLFARSVENAKRPDVIICDVRAC
ncbi:hypothetical protein TSACC_2978 [Terrimicrobium sacchariphilum]|uniref:Uncharacterized protein n=1 Tax=Terrimicrobium sacchariphilum TaxID=690879 RepID=A0A146G438_TERSA|nr:hypothetical protein TSACC_2978 [Terrimicrobium sacchariphilum]